MPHVFYDYDSLGYSVRYGGIDDHGFPVGQYDAGNHPYDSKVVVEAYTGIRVTVKTLRKWARQTAEEIAKERGLGEKVYRDRFRVEEMGDARYCII